MSSQSPVAEHRTERILAYMVAGTVGVSIVAFFAVMIGTLANANTTGWIQEGIWPFVVMLPWFGLPLGFLLLIALLIVNGVRRGRESRGSA
ncbi:multidrug ABC transporter ATPase [Agromyces intestinalis]|uniref:Multidrug ABC transporter ATPase n=1 Tax=Agromyces intestinalis TaxID=2592652 RepID=A0A5C1YIH9_9MICO|nr:multidrug ABC transporter ATPase [Agromyces intestinalis]QEO15325.1 multidrug ABC transporter ATPase [Agromyces intestinalis]